MKKVKMSKKSRKKVLKAAKKIGLALFVLFFVANLNNIQPTNSAFRDTEDSPGNEMEAGSLDLELSSSAAVAAADFRAGQTVAAGITAENNGSVDLQYKISFSKTSGDDALCSALQLEARKNGAAAYNGALDMLDLNAGNLDAGDDDDWNFDVSLPAGSPASLQNLDCNFSFFFTAWQTDLPNATNGYSDSEIFPGSAIHSGDWTAPEISGREVIKVAGTRGSANGNLPKAMIVWQTDEQATSNVVYDTSSHGTCAAYAFQSPNPADTSANNTAHSVELPNLVAGTTYHYRILTEDGSGNIRCSASDYYFTALSGIPGALTGNIVLNEIVPNPAGADDALMPGGEWVEIYNKGTTAADDTELAGWTIYDHTLANGVAISTTNTNTGSTMLAHGQWLAVYMNKSYLSNDDETVYFYNGSKDDPGVSLVDSHSWSTAVPDDKSIARFPDGTGVWIDPENTPGEENKLGEKELAEFRELAFEKCFDAEGKLKKSKEDVCQAEFLVYIGMLKKKSDRMMAKDMQEMFLAENLPPDGKVVPAEPAPAASAAEAAPEISNDSPAPVEVDPAPAADSPIIDAPDPDENAPKDEVEPGGKNSDTGKPETPEKAEPETISKEFKIELVGKPDAPEGFEAETDQKIKKIELKGEKDILDGIKDFEIDLAKIKMDKAGKIEIAVGDLDLPKGADLVGAKKDDIVLMITVSEKEKPEEDLKKAEPEKDEPKKEDSKKDEKVSASLDDKAVLKEEEKKDDKKDDGKDDPKEKEKENGGNGEAPKSVDSAAKK